MRSRITQSRKWKKRAPEEKFPGIINTVNAKKSRKEKTENIVGKQGKYEK